MRCAVRSRTASGPVAASSILHHHLDQLHRRCPGRHRDAVGQFPAVAIGAKPLKPEKSVNLSFGATANPLRGLTLTADVYQIDIRDRIVFTETLGTGGTGNTATVQSAVTALLAASGFPQVAAARFFFNGLDTRTVVWMSLSPIIFGAGNFGPLESDGRPTMPTRPRSQSGWRPRVRSRKSPI